MALSSICSASSYFSFEFSDLSAFSFLASDTSTLTHASMCCRATHPAELGFLLVERRCAASRDYGKHDPDGQWIPWFRQISAVETPPSCSLIIPIICSSLNRDFFIIRLQFVGRRRSKSWKRLGSQVSHIAEKILLLNTIIFRGDYPSTSIEALD